jgi:glycosyltransferase involved in cell wall biosynthesis
LFGLKSYFAVVFAKGYVIIAIVLSGEVVVDMTYKASIVIPLLCQPDCWLNQCVVSAATQTISTEVIVVRSDATPRSNVELLERLAVRHTNLVTLVEEKRNNFPAAINQGIRAAQTDRIGFLLSDDWLEQTAVAETIIESADIVSSGTFVHFADGKVNELASLTPSMGKFLACRTLEQMACYLEHFFLFRKKRLLLVGGLDENIGNYPGIDDYDLIWTLLEKGVSVSIIERRLYHYRDHDRDRLTLQDPEVMVANLRKILRKHGVEHREEEAIIKRHAPWFGKPIYKVMKSESELNTG